nr:glycosyltransferase [Methanosphaera stadtmanae]
MNQKVSIVIPVYNVEKYIERCLKSILNQTLDSIEVIVIDDGSTDNSGKICDEFSTKYKNVKTFHKRNGGVSSARNLGISIAKGEYIGFVDPDDFIHVNMYKELYENAKKVNSDIAICSFKEIKGNKIYKEDNTVELMK